MNTTRIKAICAVAGNSLKCGFKKTGAFFKEMYHRFNLESPESFKVLQKIFGIATSITGIPALLMQYKALGVEFPEWMHSLCTKSAALSFIVMFTISKLPVKDPNAVKITKNGEEVPALPFSKLLEQAQEKAKQVTAEEVKPVA